MLSPWKMFTGCGFLFLSLITLRRTRQPRYLGSSTSREYNFQLQGTEDTELTLTREGDFVGSEQDNVEEINIFEGEFNRITFEQVYTKTFKCTYQLQLYPFDTQVRGTDSKNSFSIDILFKARTSCIHTMIINVRSIIDIQVCTVNLIVRKLETSVMAITPHLLDMESETVLTQYLITNWTLTYNNESNVDAGIKMTLVLKRRILNAILTVYLPTILVLIIVYATNFFKDFFFEAIVTVNLTSLLVLTTLFISVAGSLPQTVKRISKHEIDVIRCFNSGVHQDGRHLVDLRSGEVVSMDIKQYGLLGAFCCGCSYAL